MIMRNWGLVDFWVQLNWPGLIWQVQLAICTVRFTIQAIQHQIRSSEPTMSHISLYYHISYPFSFPISLCCTHPNIYCRTQFTIISDYVTIIIKSCYCVQNQPPMDDLQVGLQLVSWWCVRVKCRTKLYAVSVHCPSLTARSQFSMTAHTQSQLITFPQLPGI